MLSVRGLRVNYGPIEVIHGIDIDVGEGECVALIGANGAGKSSTLKAISGLVPAAGGTVTFDGKDITNQSGHVVVKVLEGGEVPQMLKDMRQAYEKVELLRPEATRKRSTEIFLVGLRKKRV